MAIDLLLNIEQGATYLCLHCQIIFKTRFNETISMLFNSFNTFCSQ